MYVENVQMFYPFYDRTYSVKCPTRLLYIMSSMYNRNISGFYWKLVLLIILTAQAYVL